MNSISPVELAELGTTPAVLDVRQPEEYAQARVVGARLVPLMEVPSHLDEIRTMQPVYVMCHAGGRSAQATQFLTEQGIDAINVDGGITAWISAGLPVESGNL